MLWYVPGLLVRSGPDGAMFLPGILFAMSVELAIIAIIWVKLRQKAKPFLVAAAFIVAQMMTMTLLKDTLVAKWLLAFVGHLPSATIVGSGFVIGGLTSWAGWLQGRQRAISTLRKVQHA